MAKKVFWRNQMLSEDVNSYLVSGKYFSEDAVAEIHDGALVVIGDFIDHEYYNGVKDLSCRKITAPQKATDEVGIVDLVERSHGVIMDNDYRLGRKTAGLVEKADIPVRVRLFAKYDSFSIGSGNIDGTPVVGQYLVVKGSGSTLFAPAAEMSKTGICLKIEAKMPLTEGMVDTDDLYLCTVVNTNCGEANAQGQI